ncbi:Glycine--tRNA ligase [Thalassoglobus neptunius]|uniref:Glycine--tRNA ligase n=2 Tax=Thalassoglobus neptunius TaxID=1938619 RepID=A0A5C5X203_9PLAN|nr:glycine--tRNA ligase [Thalassoglobus neptunius]TWT57057.1 Glycine--tRNA ligase [Thalassoglobus neptunius]
MMSQSDRSELMDKVVSLCKRRGFIFQDSEIYGGQNGFWDYGPLGTELKRNVRESWWHDMVSGHDPIDAPEGAPQAFQMVGVETTIIMNPQVWKCSGHYDLFVDKMVDCKEAKKRYRHDHVNGRWVTSKRKADGDAAEPKRVFVTAVGEEAEIQDRALSYFGLKKKYVDRLEWEGDIQSLTEIPVDDYSSVVGPDASEAGTLTAPRDFNLMFRTIIGALGTDDDAAFLRPETAQGIFVNFKNVVDSSRVKLPLGICQIGKSFRNEITPRNFTFRSREFEQMEIEFFCHPDQSQEWYTYWRNRRFAWYTSLGIQSENLILREHHKEELAHYSVGTADIEYAFPFLPEGDYGELEGVAHRGDFDLRSHMEGKLKATDEGTLEVELNEHGQPKYRGSGKDLTYFDDQIRERFIPHVIEPSAGADRATLAFLCEAYFEDKQPDEKGKMQSRVVMRFHPRLAPIKAAVFPLVKKDGQPEKAKEIYRALKAAGIAATYDEQAAIGRRYRRQDEIGTPWCLTVDGETLENGTVTIRDRDSLEQTRISVDDVVDEISKRLRA